ncbi:LysR family transcriptional regulator [Beijerinckia sp. L45]|uniref:LysR family transcriptional regulator n=1 Tax=Beijerinckia sp. L45 TaxID=1641855 RepID=UPI00131D6704|nr:LysR family transcriptional regulator [Beijerinckia sp. L45]
MSKNPRDVKWEHLRSLLAVTRGGTFTAAAKSLGVKHSTISRHLSGLEECIQSKVLVREGGGLRVTSAGERLIVAAEVMEQQMLQAQEDIAGRDLLVGGTVRIGAPDGLGALFLAPRLAPLMAEHPGLSIQLVAMPRIFNVTTREADIAIALAVPEHGRFVAQKLCSYSLGLYASDEYLKRHPPIRDVTDLKTHNFINYIDDLIFTKELNYLDEVCAGVTATFQSSNIIAQMEAAVGGCGICILPFFLAKGQPKLRQVLPEIVLQRTWYVLTQDHQKDLGRIRTVLRFLMNLVQANEALLNQP